MNVRKENIRLELSTYTILKTGSDGGHCYVTASIRHNGRDRTLAVFFQDKTDEKLLKDGETIAVIGTLMDDHPQNSLLLLNAKLV